MKIKLLSCIIFLSALANAQTIVPPGNVYGLWLKANSPYNVIGHITVPQDCTLIIQAGVQVKFQSLYKLNVKGNIQAIGAIADTIEFTNTYNTQGFWGIRFDSTSSTQDSSRFLYCKIYNGKAAGTGKDTHGGAFFMRYFSKVRIENCRITKNTATGNGNAIYCDRAAPVIVNNTISDNGAVNNLNKGGAIYAQYSRHTISGNTMNKNLTGDGGAIYLDSDTCIVSNNIIQNNTASRQGGGIFCIYGALNIHDNLIEKNKSQISGSLTNGGGGMYFELCSSQLTNNIVKANRASASGGGIFFNNCTAATTNNTIANDTSGSNGYGVHCFHANVVMTGDTIINNGGFAVYFASSKGTIRNGVLRDNQSAICTDKSKSSILNNDISNNKGHGIYSVNGRVTISNNTISNNTAADGAGIETSGDTAFISGNIISGNIATNSGGGIYAKGRDTIVNNTISNNKANSAGYGGGGIYCMMYGPLVANNLIEGNSTPGSGGGILTDQSAPKIDHNIISNNSSTVNNAITGGAGIFCNAPSGPAPSITNNTIRNNSTSSSGGGIFWNCSVVTTGTLVISYNTISNNSCSHINGGGGGIYFGSYTGASNMTSMVNNVITNNTSSGTNGGGGGIYWSGTNNKVSVTNNTIANNNTTGTGGGGGGLYFGSSNNILFKNNIVYGNTAAGGKGNSVYLFDNTNQPAFYYCDIEGDSSGFYENGGAYTGTYFSNIDSLPDFVAPSPGSGSGFNGVNADWSLLSSSPCINSGSPSGFYPAKDKAGNPRVTGGIIDMGAYELPCFSSSLFNSFVISPPTCGNSNGSVYAAPAGGSGPYTYLWSNGSTTSGITGLSGAPGDTLILTLADSSSCIIKDTAIVQCFTGAQNHVSENEIKIFPNPFTNEFNLLLPGSIVQGNLEIYNALGVCVHSMSVADSQTYVVRFNGFPGIYFLHIRAERAYGGPQRMVKTIIRE